MYDNVLNLSIDEQQWVDDIWKEIENKMDKCAPRNRGKLPISALDGVYNNALEKEVGNLIWTNGFWGGMMWIMYEQTKNEMYKDIAIHSEKLLDEGLMEPERLYHDVGFMWHLTSGANYRITGDISSMRKNLTAANALAARFHLKGEFIRALNEEQYSDGEVSKGMTIIDTMMNLPLLYWASYITKDNRYRDIAMAHADTTLKEHLRSDGSVNHIVLHDTETGEMIGTRGGQGYGEGSSWSRGQAWAIYGFALSYKHTKEQRYIDAAKSAAHYFISCVCDNFLTKADFRAPKEPVIYDSSAGAIAVCGLLEIAELVEPLEREIYKKAALNMLKAMAENWFDNSEKDGLLKMASGAYAGDNHIDLIFGDYFWIEAFAKLRSGGSLMW